MTTSGTISMSIHRRKVTEADKAVLLRIYASTREEELQLVDWTAQQKNDFLEMQFHAQDVYYQKIYPHASYEILLVENEPAGRLYVNRSSETIRIIDITLLPEFRNHGIATRLLQEILDESNGRGVPASIHVEQYNPAQKLYLRLGFQLIEQNGIYWLMQHTPSGEATAHGQVSQPLGVEGDSVLC